MAQVTRLAQCYRCRRVFPARAGERFCPDCRREAARERNRRRLAVGDGAGSLAPLLWVAGLTLAGAAVGHPYGGAAAGIVCAAGARRPWRWPWRRGPGGETGGGASPARRPR